MAGGCEQSANGVRGLASLYGLVKRLLRAKPQGAFLGETGPLAGLSGKRFARAKGGYRLSSEKASTFQKNESSGREPVPRSFRRPVDRPLRAARQASTAEKTRKVYAKRGIGNSPPFSIARPDSSTSPVTAALVGAVTQHLAASDASDRLLFLGVANFRAARFKT
jgi:hypothetical protein